MLKRLGCDVDVLDNGQSALDATANKDYDIVFMDCQMPVMDGYQATRELRNREGNQKHLTVIAMTAHALSGDKEKCLAAGMDDYIPKPVKQQDLINAIEKWGNRSNGNGNGAAETEAHSEMKLDLTSPFAVEIFERMDDLCAALDVEDIVEIIDQFITDSPAQLQKLINAVASKDTQNLVLIAHSLKGSLANLGSAQLSKYCADIEHQARKDSMDGVEQNLSELKNSWSKLEKVFLAYKDKISLQSA
jgi:CheY-like chemotaxis protein